MLAGANDTRIDVFARSASIGGFAKTHSTWASWRYLTGAPGVEAGFAEDQAQIELKVVDSPRNRAIGLEHRITFKGQDCAVAAVSPPDRISGNIAIRIVTKIGG